MNNCKTVLWWTVLISFSLEEDAHTFFSFYPPLHWCIVDGFKCLNFLMVFHKIDLCVNKVWVAFIISVFFSVLPSSASDCLFLWSVSLCFCLSVALSIHVNPLVLLSFSPWGSLSVCLLFSLYVGLFLAQSVRFQFSVMTFGFCATIECMYYVC